jgi:AcrR family transcriptional regulator
MKQSPQPAERTEPTKSEVAGAARTVFQRRGFAGASLDEIAAEADCSKQAVDSTFANMYELFLAAFDEQFRQRFEGYSEAIFGHNDPEDSYRALARFWREATEHDPEWARLLTEFLLHASRDQALRATVQAGHGMGMERMADMFEALATRHGIEFTLPMVDVALGSAALARGLEIEQLVNPDISAELIEEMNVAFMRGLTKRA